MNHRHLIAVAIAALMIGSVSTDAFAKGNFAKHHPRRAEVLHRTNNIKNTLKSDKGHLGGHYKQLAHEDQHIRREEQRDARRHDGHITKREQHQLNQQENRLNRQIRRDKTQ